MLICSSYIYLLISRYDLKNLSKQAQMSILFSTKTVLCVIFVNQIYIYICTAGVPISYTLGGRWNVVITRPDFNSKTNFGFLSPNYTGHVTCFFVKPQNGLFGQFWRFYFLLAFFHLAPVFELKINVLRCESDARYECKSSL